MPNDTFETLELFVRVRRVGTDLPRFAVVVQHSLGGGTYELTKDYDSRDEAVTALAGFLRVATVEHEGR